MSRPWHRLSVEQKQAAVRELQLAGQAVSIIAWKLKAPRSDIAKISAALSNRPATLETDDAPPAETPPPSSVRVAVEAPPIEPGEDDLSAPLANDPIATGSFAAECPQEAPTEPSAPPALPPRNSAHEVAAQPASASVDRPNRGGVGSQTQDEALGRLIGNGLSASKIAAELGISRNSVIGRCHRLRLQLPGARKGVATGRKPQPKPAQPKLPAVVRQKLIAGVPHQPVPQQNLRPPNIAGKAAGREFDPGLTIKREDYFLPIPGIEPISLIATGSTRCKWLVNGLMGREDLACGAAKADVSSPYCAAHSRIAFNPAPLKRLSV